MNNRIIRSIWLVALLALVSNAQAIIYSLTNNAGTFSVAVTIDMSNSNRPVNEMILGSTETNIWPSLWSDASGVHTSPLYIAMFSAWTTNGVTTLPFHGRTLFDGQTNMVTSLTTNVSYWNESRDASKPYGRWYPGNNPTISQYGGNLIVGDTITVGTDVVTIISISGDAITVAESFTWASNDPVYLGSDSTPDIGAYPYRAGGYDYSVTVPSFSTQTNQAATITATVTNPEVVRFVVFYIDGVPLAVDNLSPYQASWTPAGTNGTTYTVEAKAYPLYASSTLSKSYSRDVTLGDSPPAVTYRTFSAQ